MGEPVGVLLVTVDHDLQVCDPGSAGGGGAHVRTGLLAGPGRLPEDGVPAAGLREHQLGPPPLAHAEGRRSSPMCRFPDDYANRAAVALRWPATGVPFDRTARRPRHEDQLRATQPPGGDGSPGCHSAPALCRHVSAGRLQKPMKMSWVTLDRICAEEMLSDEKIRRLVEGGNRPLRSRAEQLSDEEPLDKLRGFGLDLDRHSLERLCEGALSAEA